MTLDHIDSFMFEISVVLKTTLQLTQFQTCIFQERISPTNPRNLGWNLRDSGTLSIPGNVCVIERLGSCQSLKQVDPVECAFDIAVEDIT